jgi:multiple sugar transport system permease protein
MMSNLLQRKEKVVVAHERMPGKAWFIICSCIAVMVLYPLVASLMSSLKDPKEAQQTPPSFFPQDWSFSSFRRLTGISDGVTHYIVNSSLLAAGTVFGTLVLSVLAGYGFARFKFKTKGLLFGVILLMIMIPFQALLTPIYVIFGKIGLQNNLVGLCFIYITYQLPFSIFVMRNSFAEIPSSLEEAAIVDGCSPWTTFSRVMLPLAVPGCISVALFAFFASWNEFLAALILMNDQANYTLPIMLTLINARLYGQVDWGLMQAGVIVTMIPCMILFLTLQKYYVQGLMTGGVKA